LPLIAALQFLKVGARTFAPGYQLLHLGADIAAISLAAIPRTASLLLGFFRIVGIECLAVSLDLLVQTSDLLPEPASREDAVLASVAVEQGAVDRYMGAADQLKLAHKQHETAIRCLQGCPVLLAELGDRPIAGLQVLQ